MDYLIKRLGKLEDKLNNLLENDKIDDTSLQITKEITEILSDALNYLNQEKQINLESKAELFIDSRIKNINNNDTPIELKSNAKVIFHLIPLSKFEYNTQLLDISNIHQNVAQLPPFGIGSYNYKYNVDGYLTYNNNVYTQVFRNGCIEAVSSRLLNEEKKLIYGIRLESLIVNITNKYSMFLKDLGIGGPFLINITLIGIKNYTIGIPFGYFFDQNEIDKNEISLPKVIIKEENLNNVEIPLKKAFDVLWNAVGLSESINYENGLWKPKNQ